MDCYLIPSGNGLPTTLAGTQSDARQALRARGIKGHPKDFEHDVPTKKADLLAYVDELLERADGACARPVATPQIQTGEPDPERPMNAELGLADDGFPRAIAHITSIQVQLQMQPRSKHLNDLCYHVSKLHGVELAWVAAEVFGRVTSLSGGAK